MASRQIAIRISIDNRDAINAAKAQAIAMSDLSTATEKHTQLQDGLTNSFIKGNLAARAISVAYGILKDSFQEILKSGAELEFTLAKIQAISGESTPAISALSNTINELALSSTKSAVAISKGALEMTKMGLNVPQVRLLLESVTQLSVAMDEDLVKSGGAVVSILNSYGESVLMGKQRTEELAFTVGASALDMDSFATAFGYVGATAHLAGVRFEDLAAAMDVLSNSGIRASTIGTQLRRIISDLSNENSKASKSIGGTIESLGGLVPALEKLRQAMPKGEEGVAFLTEKFGRQASSVAAILALNNEQIAELSKNTEDANGSLSKMSDLMSDTLIGNWEHFLNIMKTLGTPVAGGAKAFLAGINDVLDTMLDKLHEAGKAFHDFTTAAETKNSVAKGGGFGDLLVGDQDKLKEQIKNVDALIKKTQEAGGEAKATSAQDILDRVKTDFEVYKTFGGVFDFKGTEKQLTELANSLLKIGEAKEAVKVMRELREIQREYAKEQKPPKLLQKKPIEEIPENFGAPKESEVRSLFARVGADLKSNLSPKEKSLQELDKYFKQLKESIEPAQVAVNGMKVGVDYLSGSIDIFGTAVEDAFRGRTGVFDNFKHAIHELTFSVIHDLIAMEAKILAVKAALAIFGLFTGGASTAVAPTLINNGFGDMISGATLSAAGTDEVVRKPKMFIAGESGAERVRIGSNSSGGGGGNTFIIQGDVYDYDKFMHKVKAAQDGNRKAYV